MEFLYSAQFIVSMLVRLLVYYWYANEIIFEVTRKNFITYVYHIYEGFVANRNINVAGFNDVKRSKTELIKPI